MKNLVIAMALIALSFGGQAQALSFAPLQHSGATGDPRVSDPGALCRAARPCDQAGHSSMGGQQQLYLCRGTRRQRYCAQEDVEVGGKTGAYRRSPRRSCRATKTARPTTVQIPSREWRRRRPRGSSRRRLPVRFSISQPLTNH